MKLAYLVSRFPHVSETFILRELNAVAAEPDTDVTLCSLFPAVKATVHAGAVPWLPRLLRPTPRRAVRDLLHWTARRPARVALTVARITRGYAARPALLARALATFPLAASHARTLERARVEHVHAHYATYPALAAWVIQRLADIDYSFTAHAHDIYVDRHFLAQKLFDARFVVTISEYNRRLLEREADGVQASTPVHVIRCGIDVSRYQFRARRPPDQGPVQAVCVASLQEYKGHRVLVDALARGGPELERLEIDLVGSGTLRPSVEQQATQCGVSTRLRFHGSLTEGEVGALLDAATLFVLPSIVAANGQMEGLPVALIEALACGLVVVTTSLSGIPELIDDGRTGFLADPGDPDSLAAALRRALSPEAARLQLDRGREIIEREYDITRNAGQLASLLRSAQRGS